MRLLMRDMTHDDTPPAENCPGDCQTVHGCGRGGAGWIPVAGGAGSRDSPRPPVVPVPGPARSRNLTPAARSRSRPHRQQYRQKGIPAPNYPAPALITYYTKTKQFAHNHDHVGRLRVVISSPITSFLFTMDAHLSGVSIKGCFVSLN